MGKRISPSSWIEVAVSAACGVLCSLTLVSREWIEVLFGVDPDGGSGELEWLIVASLFVVAIGSAVRACREWRRERRSVA
jgi:hypothetical protein